MRRLEIGRILTAGLRVLLVALPLLLGGGGIGGARPRGEPAAAADSALLPIGGFEAAVAFAVDPSGTIYVLDGGTNELLKYGPQGKLLARTGGYGWQQGTFDHPADVAAPNGLDVYVADFGNHRIQRFDRNLNAVAAYATRQHDDQALWFGYPRSVALSRFGSLFVVDGENRRIVRLAPGGRVEMAFGDVGSGSGKLSSPRRVRVSADDLVYVLDGKNVAVFDVFGNYRGKLAPALLKDVRSLAVDDSVVTALDSCASYTVGGAIPAPQRVAVPPVILDRCSPCDFVDVQVAGPYLYVLTPHMLFRKP